MNRRSFLKKISASALALLGIGGGTYYYARDIEPGMLKIKHETLSSGKIPASFDGINILQFSDTHVGFHYSLEQLDQLAAEINAQNPDIVLFTGDLVDEPNQFNWDNQIVTILKTINAPLGKYWVYGNHDHGGYGTETVKKVMDAGGFALLQNSHVNITRGETSITIAGVDDVMLGKPDLDKTLNGANQDNYTIIMIHEPDYADKAKNYPVDVQVSGHSHGGQVQIPLVGHVYTPAYAEKYVEGTYHLDDRLQLFVSRGIGTTRLPYRFLCAPEMTVFSLKSSQ
ncbi:metallophosphoesterase [Sediminibacillus albus]|uniref:Calcineurin-like phosphoesterase domain-containing protein n=1 Tax=Sediminibacillus albus TaxID=407036 RepID=A0A1G8WC63_9BACI|nr:metallophosphoesterase [Sediminibacillus albus]SDJ75756.1 hypothetical protein SAMN05216243_0689 [Sediminibacillus albus]